MAGGVVIAMPIIDSLTLYLGTETANELYKPCIKLLTVKKDIMRIEIMKAITNKNNTVLPELYKLYYKLCQYKADLENFACIVAHDYHGNIILCSKWITVLKYYINKYKKNSNNSIITNSFIKMLTDQRILTIKLYKNIISSSSSSNKYYDQLFKLKYGHIQHLCVIMAKGEIYHNENKNAYETQREFLFNLMR